MPRFGAYIGCTVAALLEDPPCRADPVLNNTLLRKALEKKFVPES